MYGRERPPTPLRTPGLLAPEAVTKTSCPPDALRASRGAPVSWSVSGGCPSTQVRRGSSSFVEVRSFFVVAVVLFCCSGDGPKTEDGEEDGVGKENKNPTQVVWGKYLMNIDLRGSTPPCQFGQSIY